MPTAEMTDPGKKQVRGRIFKLRTKRRVPDGTCQRQIHTNILLSVTSTLLEFSIHPLKLKTKRSLCSNNISSNILSYATHREGLKVKTPSRKRSKWIITETCNIHYSRTTSNPKGVKGKKEVENSNGRKALFLCP